MKILNKIICLAAAALLITALPGKLSAQLAGPYKNGAGASGNANTSTGTTQVNDISNTSFDFPMIGLGKTASAPQIQADGSYKITYSFAVKNYSNLPLNNVQVTDVLTNTFPLPVTYTVQSISANGGLTAATVAAYDGTAAKPGLLAAGTLAANATGNITLVVIVVNNGYFGTLNNTARVTAKTADGTDVFDDSHNNTNPDGNNNGNPFDDNTPTPVVISKPDIALTKTVNNATPAVGSNVIFTITAKNQGADAAQVTVNDLLPSGYDFVSATPSTGTYNSATGVWTIGTLLANITRTLTITAKVKAAGIYLNTASNSSSYDADPSNNSSSASTTPTPVADMEILQSVSNTTPDVGSSINLTLTAHNYGPSDATNVTVTDVLKPGFTIGSLPAGVTYNSGTRTITWTIGNVANGATSNVSIPVTVNANGTTSDYSNTATITATETDPVLSNNTSTAQVTPNPVANLKVQKALSAPSPLYAGNTVSFILTVTNNGPSNATGVKVNDLLKTGYTFSSYSATAGSYDNNTGLWSIGNLANGGTATLTLTAVVNASGVYDNTATVNGNEKDSDPSDNSASVAAPIVSPAVDIQVTKSVDNTAPDAGSNVVFTLRAANNGPSNATNVAITDVLPSGYTFVSALPASDYNSGTGVWTIGNLNNGSAATLYITARVNATGSFTNTATLSNVTEHEVNTANNTASAAATPVAVSDLSVVKTVNNSQPDIGSQVTFTIVAANHGPSNATGVTVQDILPDGYTLISSNTASGSYSGGTWTIGNLNNNASATLTIVAQLKASGNYANTATISGDQKDNNPGNNTSTAAPTGVPVADISVQKTASTNTPDVGSVIAFTIKAFNNGPSNATGIVINESLPAGYAFASAAPTQGSYDAATGKWTIGNLAAGTGADLQLTATVHATGSYSNTASVNKVNEKDNNPANDQSTITPVPVPVTDLQVTESVSENNPYTGNNVTFTITATNNGPSNATQVMVTDPLPSGYSFVSADGSYDAGTGVWTIGNLANGASTTLHLVAKVNASGNYANAVHVSGHEKESNTANNDALVTIAPVTAEDLQITEAVDNLTPDVRSNVNFTLTVTNNGPSDGTGVQVNAPLKPGFSFVNATTANGSYDAASGVWTIGNLAKGQSVTLNITALVNPDQPGNYDHASAVTGNETDLNPANNAASVTVTPAQVADVEITKLIDNAQPEVTTQVHFTLRAKNNGPSNATGITVTDILKSGYSFVSATATAGSYDNTTGKWTLPGLPANGTPEQLVITALVNTTGNYDNSATIAAAEKDNNLNNNFSAISTPQPIPVTDLQVVNTVSKPQPDVSEQIQFQVQATNNGPSDATGVKVADLLPEGYTFINSVANAGSYDATSGVWDIGSLANGASATLTLTVRVNAGGSYSSTATVTGNELDKVPANNTSTAVTTPVPVADLFISKTISNSTPDVGSTVTFTLTVKNNGASDATGVTVTDILQSGYSFASASASVGLFDAASGKWIIGSLPNDATATLQIAAVVNASGNYENLATVTGNEKDNTPANNSSKIVATPVPVADLAVTKTISNNTPNVGSNVQFTITVKNLGPSDATHVAVADLLGNGYTYVSSSATTGSYDAAAGKWTIGNLQAGTSVVLTITATVNASGNYANTAVVSATEKDNVPGNNSSTVTPVPVPVTDLQVTNSVSNTTPDAGTNITFTLTAQNNGPSDATGVTVTNLLPPGYSFVSAGTATGGYNSSNGVWTIGSLPKGATATLQLIAQVNGTGNYTDVATITGNELDIQPANNSSSAVTTPAPVVDLQIVQTASVAKVNKGEAMWFDLTVTNNGPSPATQVQVTDLLPAGYTYTGSNASAGSYNAANGQWNIGNLPMGGNATLRIMVQVNNNGPYGNDAVVSALEKEVITTNNRSNATVIINDPPVAHDDAATTEEPTPVTIPVTGNDTGDGIIDNAAVAIHTPPQHGVVTVNGDGTVTYTPQNAYAGTDNFTYSVKDKNGNTSNIATVTIQVLKRKLDIAITKKIITSAADIEVGKNIQFEITVTNLGTKTASGIQVTDILADNIGGNDVSVQAGTGNAVYTAADKKILWQADSLKGGASITATVTAKVISGGEVQNTAAVTANEEDPDTTNNTATVNATLGGTDDLFIPNVFTPNGDGKNERFVILGLDKHPGSVLMIYNRWGNMVYQSSNYKNDWNGSGLNAGTYYYLLKCNTGGSMKVYKGWVELIR